MAAKEGDIPADVVVTLLEMSDAMHKGSYSLQVQKKTRINQCHDKYEILFSVLWIYSSACLSLPLTKGL